MTDPVAPTTNTNTNTNTNISPTHASAGHYSSANTFDPSSRGQQQPQQQQRFFPLRMLINSRDAGVVIGKAGQNVQEIREHTEARVRVSEHVPGATERVLIVQGSPESISAAYEMIANNLAVASETHQQMQQQQENAAPRRFPSNKSQAIAKILVPHVLMGAIIGKGGANIRDIQENSGCRIVASEHLLANSTDRCVTVTGELGQVREGVYRISKTLFDCTMNQDDTRLQGHIAYRPTAPKPSGQYSANSPSHGGQYRRQQGSGNYDHGNSYQNAQTYGTNDNSYHNGPDYSIDGSQRSAPVDTECIEVPNSFVGAIIGKGGSRIREIRDKSGSQIRIGEPDGSDQRKVSVIGTKRSNQKALLLIYSRLEAEKKRLSEMAAAAPVEGTEAV